MLISIPEVQSLLAQYPGFHSALLAVVSHGGGIFHRNLQQPPLDGWQEALQCQKNGLQLQQVIWN